MPRYYAKQEVFDDGGKHVADRLLPVMRSRFVSEKKLLRNREVFPLKEVSGTPVGFVFTVWSIMILCRMAFTRLTTASWKRDVVTQMFVEFMDGFMGADNG